MYQVYQVVHGKAIWVGQQRVHHKANHLAKQQYCPIAYVRRGLFTFGLSVIAFMHSGCSLIPDVVKAEREHISHPFAGKPFGPANEEDVLNQAKVMVEWINGRYYVEMGIGYKLADEGFYGPKLTYTSRVGIKLWERK